MISLYKILVKCDISKKKTLPATRRLQFQCQPVPKPPSLGLRRESSRYKIFSQSITKTGWFGEKKNSCSYYLMITCAHCPLDFPTPITTQALVSTQYIIELLYQKSSESESESGWLILHRSPWSRGLWRRSQTQAFTTMLSIYGAKNLCEIKANNMENHHWSSALYSHTAESSPQCRSFSMWSELIHPAVTGLSAGNDTLSLGMGSCWDARRQTKQVLFRSIRRSVVMRSFFFFFFLSLRVH